LNYVLHEEVGLLHLVPKIGKVAADPIGVAVCVKASAPSEQKKYLLVDTIPVGALVDEYDADTWIPLMHESILQCAKDEGVDYVIYNLSGQSSTRTSIEKFIEYLNDNYQGRECGVQLFIEESSTLKSFVSEQYEEYEEMRKSAQSGEAIISEESYKVVKRAKELQKMLRAYLGLILDSFGGADIEGSLTGTAPGNLSGPVHGLKFEVNPKLLKESEDK
jgi:ethanolamine utilization protein EutA (predicted chaperonin)